MYKHACEVGLEGVASKLRDGRYISGLGNACVKTTYAQRETLTIAGFALDEGKGDGIYVGRRKGKDLVYAGKVDHGFDKTSATQLRKKLTPLIRRRSPTARRSRTGQDGRIHVEKITSCSCKDKAGPAEYGAGMKLAIERGWLVMHESGTFVRFTPAGAELFA